MKCDNNTRDCRNLVSVIIPTFKREKDMLNRAIFSVLNQTYDDLEVLIIDDNKETYYSEQIKELINDINNPKVTLIKNKMNIGGVASRNKGIQLAKGQLISFLDDDDFYLSSKIEKQVSFIKETNYDFVISNLAIVDGDLRLRDIRRYDWFDSINNNHDLIIEHYKHHLTGTPTFIFKKELLLEIEGFPKVPMGHEFFLTDNALKSGYRLGYLNEVLSVAVLHRGERISKSQNRQKELDNLLEFKMKSVKAIKKKDKKRIYYRHYLAKAYSYYNSKRLLKAINCLFLSFYYSPNAFIEEIKKRTLITIESRYSL